MYFSLHTLSNLIGYQGASLFKVLGFKPEVHRLV